MHEILNWLNNKPYFFLIAAVTICICIWSISSCTATVMKAEYEYKAERDKTFWKK